MPQASKSHNKHSTMLAALHAKIAQLEEGMRAMEGQKAAMKRPITYRKIESRLIKKPKGTAGRTGHCGYNLQDAMGLSEDKTKYNRIASTIRYLAVKHLNPAVSLKDQNHVDVMKVVALAQKEWPELTDYVDGWPVRAFLGQYLLNHREYNKKINRGAESDVEVESDEELEYISEAENIDPNPSNHREAQKNQHTTRPPVIIQLKKAKKTRHITENDSEELQVHKRRRVIDEHDPESTICAAAKALVAATAKITAAAAKTVASVTASKSNHNDSRSDIYCIIITQSK